MAVKDDPAWSEWSNAFDNLGRANARFDAVRHLPDVDEKKRRAWGDVKLAFAALDAAANKIEPAFKG